MYNINDWWCRHSFERLQAIGVNIIAVLYFHFRSCCRFAELVGTSSPKTFICFWSLRWGLLHNTTHVSHCKPHSPSRSKKKSIHDSQSTADDITTTFLSRHIPTNHESLHWVPTFVFHGICARMHNSKSQDYRPHFCVC